MILKKLICTLLCLSFLAQTSPSTTDQKVYKCGDGDKKRVALTFDDGPHPTLTPAILSILEKYSARATFFVIGKNAAEHPNILRRIINDGHEIGNHTYSHPHISDLSYKELCRELSLGKEKIYEITQCSTNLFRPPEGFCSRDVGSAAEKIGCNIILWTVDTKDWRSPPTEDIVNEVKRSLRPGAIILFHDYVYKNSHTPEALEILIPYILGKGYSIVTVSELLELG